MYRRIKINSNLLYFVTIAINILLPKSGLKIHGIPLTLGNLLLAICTLDLLLRKKKIEFSNVSKLIIIAILYWIARLVPLVFLGLVGPGELIGQITALIVYPASYYITKYFLENNGILSIEKLIRASVCFIMLYGIIQFIFGIGAVDIPGLTVNYSDYINNPHSWWLEKYNSIGYSTKIVSTYQNGNVFGCSLILLFPVAFRSMYKGDAYRYILLVLFLVSIILTGSRSCLIGCTLYFVYLIGNVIKNQKIRIRSLLISTAIIIFSLTLIVIWIGNQKNTELINRMFGTKIDVFLQGSGRTDAAIEYFRWISKNMWALIFGGLGADYSGGGYEMTYISVFVMGGLIGLILFLLPFIKVLYMSQKALKKDRDHLILGIKEGLTMYFITAFMEGAYWLPPTAVNVWMFIAMGVYKTDFQQEAQNKFVYCNSSSSLS